MRTYLSERFGKVLCIFLAVLMLLQAGAALAGTAPGTQEPLPVILCCDMGYMNDDAMALSMLLKLEERGRVKLLGITLTGGNNFIDADYTSWYGLNHGSCRYLTEFLQLIGREDIPVFRGTDYPLGYDADSIRELDTVHRTYLLPDGTRADRVLEKDIFGALWHFDDFEGELVDSGDAADFMIDQINADPGRVAIVAIGPTTDVARAVRKDPAAAGKAEGIYIMGGAFGEMRDAEAFDGTPIQVVPGANTSACAEYNVYYDPLAFYEVLTAGFGKIVITPGSCCEWVPEGYGEALRNACADPDAIAESWIGFHCTTYQDYPYWDPMTVFAMDRPEQILKGAQGYVTEITDINDARYGESVFIDDAAYAALPEGEQAKYGSATVVYEMEGFWDYLNDLLTDGQGVISGQ